MRYRIAPKSNRRAVSVLHDTDKESAAQQYARLMATGRYIGDVSEEVTELPHPRPIMPKVPKEVEGNGEVKRKRKNGASPEPTTNKG